jgi:hypothetical protein
MQAISSNKSRQSIDAIFDGDIQLVDMLWSYLQHNHCIEKDLASENGWKVTQKGNRWIVN